MVLVYRCIHGLAPDYLSADLMRVFDVGSRQRLHSATTSALVDRGTQHVTIGDRAFTFYHSCTSHLEQPVRGHITASVPALSEV